MNRNGRTWPLLLIAAPAAVAIWSGWVGLGGLCGFGPVQLLPGVAGGFHLNTAITLPVGVEAYAAFALGAWMSPASPKAARKFAKRSAIGALILGCAGQIVFHLLAASGANKAPWPVVVGVSCIPVIVLGFAASLTHLLRLPAEDDERGRGDVDSIPRVPPAAVPVTVPVRVPLPPYAAIRDRRGCSQKTAKIVRAEVQLDRRSRGVPALPPVAVVPAGDLPPSPAGTLNGHARKVPG